MVRMGIRSRREVRAEKDEGSMVGGGESGRKPFSVETVKGARAASSSSFLGTVVRMGKVCGVSREPIMLRTRSKMVACSTGLFVPRTDLDLSSF
jgi:hypothetical protein